MTAAAKVGDAWSIELSPGTGKLAGVYWFAYCDGIAGPLDWHDGIGVALFRTRARARMRLPEVKSKAWPRACVVRVRIGIEVVDADRASA